MGVNLTNKAIQDTYEGLVQISGSLLTDGTGSLIDNLDITASLATTASHAINSDTATSASFATTASFAISSSADDLTLQQITDNGNTTTNDIVAGGFNVPLGVGVREYNQNSITTNIAGQTFQIIAGTAGSQLSLTGGGNDKIEVGSFGIRTTGSIDSQDNITAPLFIGDLQGNADTATSASHAVFADTAGFATDVNALYTASVADATISFLKGGGGTFPITINNVANAVSASHAVIADSALTATSASHAVNADSAISSSYATTATSASHALIADGLPSDANININSITASFASFSSASIGYLQSITGSAKIIGDAFIILNNNTPTERYAGLVVQDSGSTNNTASFEFDGQTNDWFYEYTDDGGATTEHGVALFGAEYSTKGAPSYPANNVLQKGNGGHHLLDSSITDDGTLVSIDANVSASGYVSASSFIGDGSQLTGLDAGKFNDGSATESIVGKMLSSGSNASPQGFLFSSGSNITSTGIGNAILGGKDNDIEGTAFESAMIGGNGNTLGTSERGGIYTSEGSSISGGTKNPTIIGSTDSSISGGSSLRQAGIYSSRESQITGGAFYGQAIMASWSSTLNGSRAFLAGGNQLNLSGTDSVILGGQLNNNSRSASGIVAGRNSRISGGERAFMGGGFDNQITGGDGSFVVGGGLANASEDFGGVIGGSGANASHARSVVVGGNNLSTTKDDEVVVPHLTISGSTIATDISASGYVSASTYYGDGSNLTGIVASAFPYTGSADITGSLKVIGETLLEDGALTLYDVGTNASYPRGINIQISGSDNSGAFGGLNKPGITIGSGNSNGGNIHYVIGKDNTSTFMGNGAGAQYVFGDDNTISGNNTNYNTLIGRGNRKSGDGDYSVVIGGNDNEVGATSYGGIVAGTSHDLSGGSYGFIGGGLFAQLSGGDGMATIGGRTLAITGGNYNAIVSGQDNTLNSSWSAIIAGDTNSNTHDRSVVIGGQSLSTSKTDEVVVPNLTTNGAVVQNVEALSIVANVAELDASLGNLFTLTLQNGVNTELQLTNQSAGQSFQVQITNNATGAGTISFDSQFEFEGGTAFTATASTSAVDILTFVCFAGGNVQCVSAKNFS